MGHKAPKMTPELTDAQWERMLRYGVSIPAEAGDVLFKSGDRWYDLILVESGSVDVVRDPLKWIDETLIANLGPRTFVGELGLLNGQRAFLTARVAEPGRMLRVDHDALQRMMAEDDELCDLMLRTLWARREELRRGPAAWTLKIIGSERSREAVALRRYAERLDLVHTWVDADDPERAAAFAGHGFTRDDLPVAIVQGENLPHATPGQLAELLGLAYAAEDDATVDLAVVGAGPAGLAAAIYGASEGLDTVLLDAVAPGGQSSATSRIENYLGFPFGVSGDDLTAQASLQAIKFGVRVVAPCEAVRLESDTGALRLTLTDGAVVNARAVIVTTGSPTARSDSTAGRSSRAPASTTRPPRWSSARWRAPRSWWSAARTRPVRRRSRSPRTDATCASSCARASSAARCRATSSTASSTTPASTCTRARRWSACTATRTSSA